MFFALTAGIAVMHAQTAPTTQITVYNQGFGLVKEVRTFNLKSGRQDVFVEDVAQRIEPDSVAIRSLTDPGSFVVLEQNYRYDLISTMAILSKAVGGTVILNRVLPNGQREQMEGTLMSSPNAIVPADGGMMNTYNGMVIKTKEGRILLNPSGELEVKSIPEELISKPTLVWDLDSDRAGSNQVELSYITQGISWTADYVLQLDEKGANGDLKGWVSMQNNTGATFKDCTLKLLAGEVNRAPMGGGRGGGEMMDAMAPRAMKAKADMQEEQFGEYHLYTLPRPATVRNNENKQLSLMEAFKIPVTKKIIFDPMGGYRGWQPNEGEVGSGTLKPAVRYEFTNDKKSNMGMPLPAGRVKIFQHDKSGATQLLGEDRIEHTPKDEKLSIVVGRAFDIVADRKRTDFKYIYGRNNSPRGARETFVTELRNRKDVAETVTLLERYWGDWSVTKSSEAYTKLDANTIQFQVTLKAGEVRKISYSFETTWAKE